MKGKPVIFVLIFIMIVIILNNFGDIKLLVYPNKGAFDDIVMDIYKANSFDSLIIVSENGFRSTKDKNIIDNLFNTFRGFELKEVKRKLTRPINYKLMFGNKETFESLWIEVSGQNYINIYTQTMKKEVNEEKNVTRWVEVKKRKYYKIIDDDFDISDIEEDLLKLDKLD